MNTPKVIDDLIEIFKKIISGGNSIDKAVAKTVPKKPNWNHILESPNDLNSIK